MKRNFSAILKQLDGTPIKDGADKLKRDAEGRPVWDTTTSEPIVLEPAKDCTLKSICLGAIGGAIDGDNVMTGEKKYALYKLADRISKGGAVEVTTEEVATLKERIAKTYANFIVIGAAFDALEADYVEPPAELEHQVV